MTIPPPLDLSREELGRYSRQIMLPQLGLHGQHQAGAHRLASRVRGLSGFPAYELTAKAWEQFAISFVGTAYRRDISRPYDRHSSAPFSSDVSRSCHLPPRRMNR